MGNFCDHVSDGDYYKYDGNGDYEYGDAECGDKDGHSEEG
jgi:hypothetical protein